MFKRILLLIISISMKILLFIGYNSVTSNDINVERPKKLRVVTTLLPQYDFKRQIKNI